jgi:hypothetical protein
MLLKLVGLDSHILSARFCTLTFLITGPLHSGLARFIIALGSQIFFVARLIFALALSFTLTGTVGKLRFGLVVPKSADEIRGLVQALALVEEFYHVLGEDTKLFDN